MTTSFQTQFNTDVNAMMNPAFAEEFTPDGGADTSNTFEATLTLLRAESADEFPVGDSTLMRAEIRWQASDYSGAKAMDRFKREANGEIWIIPQEAEPEVDGFGEVIAQMTLLKRTKVGAV